MLERRLLRRLLIAILILGSATLLAFFSATRILMSYSYGGYSISWWRAVGLSITDWYTWALLSPIIFWLARRFPLDARLWIRALLIHLPASILLSIIKMLIEFRAAQWMSPDPRRIFPVLQLHSTVLTYWAILGIIWAFNYYIKYREHQVKASQLEARLAQAQLQALKAQLHPHFLFNTLHAISTLMHKDVEAADRMLARLSDLLRITLENVGMEEVPLKQELEFLQRYLEIEQTRFRDRLTVEMDIDPLTLDAAVPNLILQPLVENAIKHGVSKRSGPGRVQINAGLNSGIVTLQVHDDGPGVRLEQLRHGVGLANTRARLDQLYGTSHVFELINDQNGGLIVRVQIPFRPSSPHPEVIERNQSDGQLKV